MSLFKFLLATDNACKFSCRAVVVHLLYSKHRAKGITVQYSSPSIREASVTAKSVQCQQKWSKGLTNYTLLYTKVFIICSRMC